MRIYPKKKPSVNQFHQIKLQKAWFKGLKEDTISSFETTLGVGYDELGSVMVTIDISDNPTVTSSSIHITPKQSKTCGENDNPLYKSYKIYCKASSCQYGGYRYWFQCNGCRKKCNILYVTHQGLLDRSCLKAVYPTQRMSKKQLQDETTVYLFKRERIRKTLHYKKESNVQVAIKHDVGFFTKELQKSSLSCTYTDGLSDIL